MDRYEKGKELGRGTFGTVYSATRKEDGVIVAIKRVHDGDGTSGVNFTALREIKVLRDSKHPNVIGLLDVFAAKEKVFLVFELMKLDLAKVISDTRFPLTTAYIKSYAEMALQGLQYLHERWIAHRDMKPHNLLINEEGVLKIGDLGMSRSWGCEGEILSPQVVTRWYRSPELLFGAKLYDGFGVDVWAMACIICEMFNRAALFQGTSDIDQLSRIFAQLGTPTDDSWPGRQHLPGYLEYEPSPCLPLKGAVPSAPPSCLKMMDGMLMLCPNKRSTVKSVLEHEFWTEKPKKIDHSKLIPKALMKGD